MPAYQYSPISEEQVRVVIVLPGADDERLHIQMQHHSIRGLPRYSALSYCWGEGNPDVECSIESQSTEMVLRVTRNLSEALRELRSASVEVFLWADQICIDQQNDVEKVHQIRLMGEVYSKARQVVVWTGAADEYTRSTFEVLENASRDVFNVVREASASGTGFNPSDLVATLSKHDFKVNDQQWITVRKFFDRPWFSRMWCFQELALANDGIIKCGSFEIPWMTLHTACLGLDQWDTYIPFSKSTSQRAYGKLMSLMSCNQALIRKHRFGESVERDAAELLQLMTLVRINMQRASTVPHDKIYGLLGLAQDVDATSFPVDYQQQFNVIFSHVSRHFIKRHADLTALKLVSLGGPDPHILPSWVPDYRYPDDAFHNIRGANAAPKVLHGSARMYNATGSSRSTLPGSCGDLNLVLEAIVVGTITSVSNVNDNYSKENLIGKVVQSGGQWQRLAESITQGGIYASTGELIELAYARLRIADILPEERDHVQRRARNHPLHQIPEPVLNPLADASLDQAGAGITVRILHSTTKQRLFVTDTGLMGLAHESCVVGDTAYLAMGGDMPIILRELSTGMYRFLGESYIHGIMYGEFLIKTYKDNGKDVAGAATDQEWLDGLGDGPLPFPTETVVLV